MNKNLVDVSLFFFFISLLWFSKTGAILFFLLFLSFRDYIRVQFRFQKMVDKIEYILPRQDYLPVTIFFFF